MGSLVSSVADIFGLGPASTQARATTDAARIASEGTLGAAKLGAEAAQFRPVGITTRYGTSNYQFDPTTGKLVGAGYMATPELQAMQNRVDALTGAGLGYAEQTPGLYAPLLSGAQGLFSQAGQGLKATPEQQAADWLQKQQALLAPGRERESALLANQLSNTGRTGLSVAQGGGLLSANPEQAALANARAMQDLQLAANATQAGQQATNFYSGLFGQGAGLLNQYGQGLVGGYAPFNAGITTGQTLENIAQSPLDIGAQLGGRTATAGSIGGQLLASGGAKAASLMQPANALSPLASGLYGASQSPIGTAADAYLMKNIPQWWDQAGTWANNQLLNAQYGSGNVFTPSGGGSIPSGYSSFD